jgi:hypothetical protein
MFTVGGRGPEARQREGARRRGAYPGAIVFVIGLGGLCKCASVLGIDDPIPLLPDAHLVESGGESDVAADASGVREAGDGAVKETSDAAGEGKHSAGSGG